MKKIVSIFVLLGFVVVGSNAYADVVSVAYVDEVLDNRVATDLVLGGVKSSGDITVAADGTVTVNNAAVAALATSATNDANGNNIADTYQPKLTADNIQGSGSVNVSVADGVVTVAGTDTIYELPVATDAALGGVKSGGDIDVNSTTGDVTVNKAVEATKALNICSGAQCDGMVQIWFE